MKSKGTCTTKKRQAKDTTDKRRVFYKFRPTIKWRKTKYKTEGKQYQTVYTYKLAAGKHGES